MNGSTFGNHFRITTWGESHGKAIGVVVDGCPAGLALSEEDIQYYLNRRKPGQTKYATPRKEADEVRILSGVFEGITTPVLSPLASSMLKVKASLASLPSTFFVACSVTFVGVRSLFV